MKKFFISLNAAAVAIALFTTGCVSYKDQEKDEFQTFLEGSRAAENIEKTNNPSIDAIAGSSTIIYKRVGGAMREYIEQVRGDMATILLGRQIRNLDTTDEAGVEIAGRILQGLTEAEKKDWTPEKLYQAAKEKRSLQYYIASKAEDEVGAQLRNSTDPLVTAEIAAGEKVYKVSLANENWEAKIAELQKLSNDLGEITKNLGTLLQDVTQKVTTKANDVAQLVMDPAMQAYTAETTPLIAKKTFASAENKKAIDAELDTIAQKPEYKSVMDKKAQYGKELDQLKKDLDVLNNGVGTQVKFTGEAIPWLITEYTAMSKL